MSRIIRPDDRYPGSRLPPQGKKPETPDISHMHKYIHPSDKDGNGMYVLTANTKDELISKMLNHRMRETSQTFNGTVCPSSPNVIKRQGKKHE